MAGGDGGDNESHPKAFVNIIVFDKNYNLLEIAYDGINGGHQVGASPDVAHDFMKAVYAAKEECFVYVYISNENANLIDVYFDDVVMTHKRSRLIQGNEYYPFGMQTANSWTRESVTGNNYLANGGTELNATTQLYDLEFRNYDPALGRMFQVDPVAAKYASLTPYNYSFNNPIAFADPSGADPDPDYQNPNHQYYFHNGAGSAGYPGLTYDDVVPQSARGEFNSAFGWRQDVMLGWFGGGGNMGAYWHPGDGRLFWSGYESGAREYRYDQDRVKYGDMSLYDFYSKYPGYTSISVDQLRSMAALHNSGTNPITGVEYTFNEPTVVGTFNSNSLRRTKAALIASLSGLEDLGVQGVGDDQEIEDGFHVLLRSTTADIFGNKRTSTDQKNGIEIVVKTVVILRFSQDGKQMTGAGGFRIIEKTTSKGSASRWESIHRDRDWKLIVPEMDMNFIRQLEEIWRPKALMQKYWEFIWSPNDRRRETLHYGTFKHY